MPQPQIIITPEASSASLAEATLEVQRLLTKGIGFGDAGEGTDLARTAVGTPRPPSRVGTPDNMMGNFLEVTLEDGDLGTNLECHHGLNLHVPPARPGRDQLLNVRWLVAGVRYVTDNFAADLPAAADHRVLVLYADGAIGASTIELRFYTDLTLTAGANNRALLVTLFFMPASK